ncbi:MAG: helix-turn-helix transcriptional regulator [Chitinophagales bacterium]
MEKLTDDNIRIIFGMKVKRLRTDNQFSLQQLSEKTGISISYLNEIENGKKYPKTDKIADLARALNVSYDQLVSMKLAKNMAHIGHFLSLDIVNDFLFQTFGIDKGTLLSMVANEPIRVSAFINAIYEIARNYNLKQEHFYFMCLRSYQELNQNYFEEIEEAVDRFRNEHGLDEKQLLNVAAYESLLTKQYKYHVKATDFKQYPALKAMRSALVPAEKPLLFYNKKLTEQQRAFLFGRELGFNYLKLEKRPYTTPWLRFGSFDNVLNNFRASYFAQALHIPKQSLKKDLENIFGADRFNPNFIAHLLEKYHASPEMLLTRISNILPVYFGIDELFFIRYSSKEQDLKEISKELHLTRHSLQLAYTISEQNYRRWLTKSLLQFLLEEKGKAKEPMKIEAVVTENGNGNRYLTLSILREMPELNNNNNSVTLGFVINETAARKIRFLNDRKLDVSKLGDLSRYEFNEPIELKRLKQLQEREDEYELLVSQSK